MEITILLQGLCRDYIGVMENQMEITIVIQGIM